MPSFKEIINGSIPVLVDFYAEWCGPCKVMAPVVEQLAREWSGRARVLKVDVDKNQAAANAYRVQGVPTFILFNAGKIVWRKSGAMPHKELEQALSAATTKG